MRKQLPEKGTAWDELAERMRELGNDDVDWRSGRAAVYVFHAGEDVLQVAKEAYALYQSENGLGPAAFPSLAGMEADVIDIGLSLLRAAEDEDGTGACGNMTSGGSESIFMAVKACRDQAAAAGRETRGGAIIVPRSAHPAFDKAAHYLGMRVVRVPVGADLRADSSAMAAAIEDDALMIVGSAPCFPYGLIDPIDELSELALERELWLHVDACVGGYFSPFARMNGAPLPDFDFSLPGVASISADLHKYGYTAKGASTIFHRSAAQREFQTFEFADWPAGGMKTPTAAGTRPGGAIAAAWAVLHYLGIDGYREKARIVVETRERIERGIGELAGLHVIGKPQLGLLAFGSDEVDIFAVWGKLKKRGWFSGVVTEPRGIHLMLSPAHAAVADLYLEDLAAAVASARSGGEEGGDFEARYS